MPTLDDLLPLPTGLVAVVGDEGRGKTRLLRLIGGEADDGRGALQAEMVTATATAPVAGADALWLDLSLPGCDEQLPAQVWDALRVRCPRWNAPLLRELADALQLPAHADKRLFMLSTGSRRKVALAGLLAAGATVTCLDQPYAALDGPSVRVVREFLHDMADHAARTWVVADYEADARLHWRRVIRLG